MNIGLYLLIALVITCVFTLTVLGTQAKNPAAWVDDYPPDIKAAYYRHIGQSEKSKKIKAGTIIRKLIFSVVFVFVLAFLLRQVGATSFSTGFALCLVCWLWIGVYDTCFLDFVVFANWKRLRLPGTEDMDKEYHQKKFHVVAALKVGLPVALLVSVLTGGGVAVLSINGETDADRVTTVAVEGFEGHLYEVPGVQEKIVITFSGSEGGSTSSDTMAWYYQQNGIPAMGVTLFGSEQTGEYLQNIPLEYAERAIDWLHEQGYENIAVDGISKGSEYALLAASMFDDITCVVARVPSYFVSEGLIGKSGPSETSCWSYQGQKIAYTPYTAREFHVVGDILSQRQFYLLNINSGKAVTEESVIPMENINGPILLISTTQDTVWPSDEQADYIESYLAQHEFAYEVEHLSYDHISHFTVYMRRNAWLLKVMFQCERQFPEECAQERQELSDAAVEFIQNS